MLNTVNAVSDMVCALKQTILERGSPRLPDDHDAGIAVHLEMRSDYFDYASDGNTLLGYGEEMMVEYITFLFCRNTTVFCAKLPAGQHHVARFPGTGIWKPDASVVWENTSNHDSCWRTDGVRSVLYKAYRDQTAAVLAHVPEDVVKEHSLAGRLSQGIRTAAFGPLFEYVGIAHEASGDYRRTLTNVRPLTLHEVEGVVSGQMDRV